MMLNQFLAAVTARPVLHSLSGGFLDSARILARACGESFLPELARQLGSENPLDRSQAFHAIASSSDLSLLVDSRLGETERAVLGAQASRLEDMTRGLGLGGMKLLFFGDIHDTWGPVKKIVRHECPDENGLVLGVGDLETYKALPGKIPFLFSHGNHEDGDRLAAIRARPEPEWGVPYPLFSGDFMILKGGLAVGAFSGIYNREFFESGDSGTFPFFSQADVAKALGIPLSLDLFLSHEAPAGVGVLRETRDLGSHVVTEILEKLQPQVAFFGHHHLDFEGTLGRTKIVGLDYPKRSYVTAVVDESSGELRFTRHRAKLVEEGGRKVYRYDWEQPSEEAAPEPTEETRRRLFSIPMPTLMSREEETAKRLDQDYREKLTERLVPVFLPRVGKPEDTERTKSLLAEGLANGVFNTVLPYFARYFTSLKATLSEKERESLKQSTLKRMLEEKASIAFAHDDLILAFEELTKLAI